MLSVIHRDDPLKKSNEVTIDDDDSTRESLDMYLTEEGYDVEIVDKGLVGISVLIALRAKLVNPNPDSKASLGVIN